MIENKLLRNIEIEEEVIEKYKESSMYQHRTFIIDLYSLTDEERHVLKILQRKSDSLRKVLKTGENEYDIRLGVHMNDFYFHILALIKENNIWHRGMAQSSSNILLKYMPLKVMFFLIFFYIEDYGVDDYIKEIYDCPLRTSRTGVILPDVTEGLDYLDGNVLKYAERNKKFKRFDGMALRLLKMDSLGMSDAVRSTAIFRDNWEDIMENGVNLPITLEMIENAVKAQYKNIENE